jgi:hypothetical protein
MEGEKIYKEETGEGAGAEVVTPPVAEVIEVSQANPAQVKRTFTEWPMGTKWRRIEGSVPEEQLKKMHTLFYNRSCEYEDGSIEHGFIAVDYVDGLDVQLKRNPCYVASTEMTAFLRKFELVKVNPTTYPTTADGHAINIGDDLNYSFPGRFSTEKSARVRILNHAYGVAICVQKVGSSDRIMVVHSRDLRWGVYWRN